jgi:hypothetical protein
MRALEIACQDSSVPVDIDAVKQLLTKLHDLKRLMLESLMASLQDGKLLLEKLRELSTEGTLDSRPGHIKTSTEYGKHHKYERLQFVCSMRIVQVQNSCIYLTNNYKMCCMLDVKSCYSFHIVVCSSGLWSSEL